MRVAVVGAGVFGAWCAKFLADAGHRVTLIDAFGPANGRASSADHSRVIRAGYGGDAIYSRWATEALRDWQGLEEASGQSLLARTGALFMGEPDSAYVRDTYRTLAECGVAAALLEPADVQRRFPQIAVDGLGASVFEPDAGVIRARPAVQALVSVLVRRPEVSYLPARVLPPDEQRPACEVALASGAPLQADAWVFACGAWLPQLLPQAVGRRIRPTRQEVLYFGVPPGITDFSAARLPVWIDFGAGLYGIPDLDALGFKVGLDRHGPEVDPDTLDRLVGEDVVTRTRAWLRRRFPGMAGAPYVDGRVCQYENTTTGDFLIDRHPAWSNCWIVGGGSGHGFKHGPSVGRHVAALVDGRVSVHDRFALAGKGTAAARAVY